jgi:2-keto-4-pentenoate hydratase/2-oxohepta-3-ene-1,7-dioic acid hydratase in catechol pathway
MKFISFEHGGRQQWGLVKGDSVLPAASAEHPTMKSAIAAGKLEELGRALAAQTGGIALSEVKFLPVITEPGKIMCIGLNYEEHRVETGRDKTENPTVFMRIADSQIGHLQPILVPIESHELDYEGEIAVVIGKQGRRIKPADSWSHIAGYSVYNDASVRDWQRHTTQFTPGKNFVATGGFGPWLVTREEIADGEELELTTRLNGQVMQHATTAMMIFSIPELIAYVSTYTILRPGDVIVTGTPGGVGMKRKPPVWMKDGDTVEVEVAKIGVLRNPIRQER